MKKYSILCGNGYGVGMERLIMKRKVITWMISLAMTAAVLTGCGAGNVAQGTDQAAQEGAATDQAVENEIDTESQDETGNGETTDQASQDQVEADMEEKGSEEGGDGETGAAKIRVGSLKGPTSIGLVYLMDRAQKQETADHYEFTMAATADELLPSVISGDLDILLIPANVSGVLYMKTEGDISVIDINTLGVLYMVSGDDTIKEMEDLKGKTVCLTGKGTTPDYVLQYLLTENGLTTEDVKLEYKSEATEVAAMLAEKPETIGVLPQPFVTAACAQNEELSVVMDLTEQWDAVQEKSGAGSRLVTGVTIVRKGFLEENKDAVDRFLEEHAVSAAYANEHVEETAELVAAAGIIEKAPVAAKAIPECNITFIDGDDMKAALSGYLSVLYEQDAASVGGGLPGDDFYYIR